MSAGGGSNRLAELNVGDSFETASRTITAADLDRFASLTGDRHPQHTDEEWARRSRFQGRVAHGMLLLSFGVGLMSFDPEHVVALRGLDSVTFKRPVRIGDTIRVAVEVTGSRPVEDGHALLALRWRILNQDDELVARATLAVLWRDAAPATAEAEPAAGADATGDADIGPVVTELSALYGQRLLL